MERSIALQGNKGSNWKGGIYPENLRLRDSLKYREWRSAVLKRDNYTCQDCGEKKNKLQAHHLKPFAYFPELRFIIDNGRTLCINCHDKTKLGIMTFILKENYSFVG